MTSFRRTNKVMGLVRFPVRSKRWKNTCEGGMFVRLLVIPPEKREDRPVACCGGMANVLMDESLIGDDLVDPPQITAPPEHFASPRMTARMVRQHYAAEDRAQEEYEERHFPRLHHPGRQWMEKDIYGKWISIDYLAVVLIGSTGWSGYSEQRQDYWRCTKDDLTPEGRKLYDAIAKLYPKATLCLQTWLDT